MKNIRSLVNIYWRVWPGVDRWAHNIFIKAIDWFFWQNLIKTINQTNGAIAFYVHRHEVAVKFFNPKFIMHRAKIYHKYWPVPNLKIHYVNNGFDENLIRINCERLNGLNNWRAHFMYVHLYWIRCRSSSSRCMTTKLRYPSEHDFSSS